MDFRLLATTGLSLVLAGCEKSPAQCSADFVRPGIVRAVFAGPEQIARLNADLKLIEARARKTDEATKTIDCSARMVIATDAGLYDHLVNYRIGPDKSGQMVFMHITADDDLLRFLEKIEFKDKP